MDFNFSLIFPSQEKLKESYVDSMRPNISHRTCEELGLTYMYDMKSSDISDFFTLDKEVMEYRREAFADMLDNPSLKDVLLSVTPILNDITELRRLDAEASETTESYLLSISEIELYINCVDTLNDGLPIHRSTASEQCSGATLSWPLTWCSTSSRKKASSLS